MTNQELEKIYYEAYKPVYWTAMSLLKNESDAEDIVQETFIALIKSYDTIKDKSKVVSWLKKTAANKSLDRIKLTKTVDVEDDFFDNVEDVPENFLPDALLESADTRKVLMDIIENSLSEEVRRTIILYYYDEMTAKEISEVLSIPQGTVLWRLSFARKKIKKEVEKYEKDNDTRLFAMGLPFLTRLFYTEAEQVQIKPMPASLTAFLSASAVAPGRGAEKKASEEALKKGTDTMLKKIIISSISFALAGALIAGGVFLVVQKNEKNNLSGEGGRSKIAMLSGREDDTKVNDQNEKEDPSDQDVSDTVPVDTDIPDQGTDIETAVPSDSTPQTSDSVTTPDAAPTDPQTGYKVVTFGEYEGYDLKWIVLDENDNGLLLLSKDVIAVKEYHEKVEKITWKDCSLRKWLNGDFYNSAFTSQEKEQILLTVNENPAAPDSPIAGETATEDSVFLLSVDEATKYFTSDEGRQAVFGKAVNSKGNSAYWWLRTHGYSDYAASFVFDSGSISMPGYGINEDKNIGVRPAIWVSKDATDKLLEKETDTDHPTSDKDTSLDHQIDERLLGTWSVVKHGETRYFTFRDDNTCFIECKENGVVTATRDASYTADGETIVLDVPDEGIEYANYSIDGNKLHLKEVGTNQTLVLTRE
ncbi:MAG: sigma-70 family RNA polymerase sigma factor [Clostridiales bacterium]|nr:sigma-70 family RNA polymerase sigma factor [Clostridiales bacterium]